MNDNTGVISKGISISVIYNQKSFTRYECVIAWNWVSLHYGDVIMGATASLITSLTSVYSTVYSDADLRKHQSSASLAFVQGIHRGPVNSPHKWPVTRKMFPFDDVVMYHAHVYRSPWSISIYLIGFPFWRKELNYSDTSSKQLSTVFAFRNTHMDGATQACSLTIIVEILNISKMW